MSSDYFEITCKALFNLIPGIGSSMTSFISDIQVERKFKRLEEFNQEINEDVHRLDLKINKDFVQKDDFLDIFEKTSQYVISERSAIKRKLYKNILVNGMIIKGSDYDEIETFYRLLDSLNEIDIRVLSIFASPDHHTYISNISNLIFKNRGLFNYSQEVIKMAKSLLSTLTEYNPEQIMESMLSLEQYRLIHFQSNNSKSLPDKLKNKLTNKGKRFVQFISES